MSIIPVYDPDDGRKRGSYTLHKSLHSVLYYIDKKDDSGSRGNMNAEIVKRPVKDPLGIGRGAATTHSGKMLPEYVLTWCNRERRTNLPLTGVHYYRRI